MIKMEQLLSKLEHMEFRKVLILNKEKKIIKKIIGPIDKKKFNEIKK